MPYFLMWQDDIIGVARFIDACLERVCTSPGPPVETRHLISPELARKDVMILLRLLSLCRAVTYTAISRNSAQNIPAPAVMAAPSRSSILARPPPLQKPRKQHALVPPSPVSYGTTDVFPPCAAAIGCCTWAVSLKLSACRALHHASMVQPRQSL